MKSNIDKCLNILNEKNFEKEVNLILEKLGSLDGMDAAVLGVEPNKPITAEQLVKAFKLKYITSKGKITAEDFIKKIKNVFLGINNDELDYIKRLLSSALIQIK